jgi:short-subunit dehydrogenase
MTALHAIITGGSSGIGLALARKLAAAGYDLSLIARRETQLGAAAAEIRQHFSRGDQQLAVFPADVADARQAEAAVIAAIKARPSWS